MPRIRTIKPEFWGHPNPPSAWARLLYIAMFNWCDDYGVGTANPKELAAFAFPNDEEITTVALREILREVYRSFNVVLYEVGGRPYFEIQNWSSHQKVNNPSGAKHPRSTQAEKWLYVDEDNDDDTHKTTSNQDVCKHCSSPTVGLPESYGRDHLQSDVLEIGNRKEEIGKRLNVTLGGSGGLEKSEPVEPASIMALVPELKPEPKLEPKPDTSRGTRLTEDWQPSDALKESMRQEYPNLKLGLVLEEFRDHWMSVPAKEGRKLDWDRTFRNRVRVAADNRRYQRDSGNHRELGRKGLDYQSFKTSEPDQMELEA